MAKTHSSVNQPAEIQQAQDEDLGIEEAVARLLAGEPAPFDLGDYLETLPYGGSDPVADEYIFNNLIIKKLTDRQSELTPHILAKQKRYIPSADGRFYINVIRTKHYIYSQAITVLSDQIKKLTSMLKAKKEMEKSVGTAKEAEETTVISVKTMAPVVRARIEAGNDALYPEREESEDLL